MSDLNSIFLQEIRTESIAADQQVSKEILNSINSPLKAKSKCGPEIQGFDRLNWLIHLHYTRGENDRCRSLISEQLLLTGGQCEYAVYVQGLLQRKNGDIQLSLESFQRCILLNPNNIESLKQVARSLFLLARHKAALDVYTEAGKLVQPDWEISHNKGVCFMQLKNYEQAKKLLREAIAISNNVKSFIVLANVSVLENDIHMAIDIYLIASEFSPENSEILTNLGLLYMKLGQYNKAFEKLGNAMTYDPTNTRAILGVGCVMQKHADPDVALSKYKTAAAILPESAPLWNNIGMCFYDKKKYVAAISCLKRANYLAPFDWLTLYNLGLVHLYMQQYASAFHFLSAAINVRPKSALLFMLLAVALTHLEDVSNAKQAYEQAIQLDKNDSLIYLNYSIFLYNLNEKTSAAKIFAQFEESNTATSNPEIEIEINNVSSKLGPALQVGESLVWKGSDTAVDQSKSTKPAEDRSATTEQSSITPPSSRSTISSITSQEKSTPLSKPVYGPTVIPTGIHSNEFPLIARDAVVTNEGSDIVRDIDNDNNDF